MESWKAERMCRTKRFGQISSLTTFDKSLMLKCISLQYQPLNDKLFCLTASNASFLCKALWEVSVSASLETSMSVWTLSVCNHDLAEPLQHCTWVSMSELYFHSWWISFNLWTALSTRFGFSINIDSSILHALLVKLYFNWVWTGWVKKCSQCYIPADLIVCWLITLCIILN